MKLYGVTTSCGNVPPSGHQLPHCHNTSPSKGSAANVWFDGEGYWKNFAAGEHYLGKFIFCFLHNMATSSHLIHQLRD